MKCKASKEADAKHEELMIEIVRLKTVWRNEKASIDERVRAKNKLDALYKELNGKEDKCDSSP